jgi:EREBP-like factor
VGKWAAEVRDPVKGFHV